MDQPRFENWYLSNSYESYLIHWLGEFDRYCRDQRVDYALFGGVAVSAYAGHLVRKHRDLDVLLPPEAMLNARFFLESRGFRLIASEKSKKAGFWKFSLTNQLYEIVIALFPGEFQLLDVDSPALDRLAVYSFRSALEKPKRRLIRATGSEARTMANVVPFEDLIISRLWPTFEPTSVHDLILLLASEDASGFDAEYFEAQLQGDHVLRALAATTFEMFLRQYQSTAWYRLAARASRCDEVVETIRTRLVANSSRAP